MSDIIQKISEEKPVGIDYKYEDKYIAIESEIDKTMSASSSGEVDWKFIKESSEEILLSSSKDLKIASYWFYSQWKLYSWEGLEKAFPIYIELLKAYGLKLFPKSEKVKLRILEWLHESLTVAFFKDIKSLEIDRLKEIINYLVYLEATIITMFNKEEINIFSPLVRKLNKIVEEKKLDVQEAVKEKDESDKKAQGDEKVDGQDNSISKETPIYSIERHIENLEKDFSLVSNEYFLFNLSFSFATSILFNLFNKDIKRELFPPGNELNELKNIKEKENRIEKIKLLLSRYKCWLEGYYYLVTEGSEETDKHNKIYLNILKYNLIYFLNNNAEKIYNLECDNYSIVSENLKKWVKSEKKILNINSNHDVVEEQYKEIKKLLNSKRKEDSITSIDSLRKNSKSKEESFLWGLKQVEVAMEIGNRKMALSILYGLNSEIEVYSIEQWKPNLAIKVYKMFLKPSISKILNNETKELFYGKLCRLSFKDANSVSFL